MKTDAMPAPLAGDDVQAIVAAGFGTLRHGEYLLLTINDAPRAREWLRAVLGAGLLASVDDVTREGRSRAAEVATIAMSCAGLQAAGVQASAQLPFPSTFSRGMADAVHARALGDGDIAGWRWGDVAPAAGRRVVHWLVAHYWQSPGRDNDNDNAAAATGDQPPHRLFSNAVLHAAGFDVLRIAADPGFIRDDGSAVEPFGFRDGLAQPVIDGLRSGHGAHRRPIDSVAAPFSGDRLIAPGEFLLGHANEYNQRAYTPDAQGWRHGSQAFAFNASYIAVRQIKQDVAAFIAFEREHAAAHEQGGVPAPTIGELMVGRLRDGTPLSACPTPNGDKDSFRYRMHDAQGFGCPRGAHVRRANPRDTLGHDIDSGVASSKLHRLLRRGRSYLYRPPGAQEDDAPERGMFFMALNADLDRQFAFVQQQWIASSTFGDLTDEADPLLGASHRSFTVQREGLALHLARIPRFTEVVGGGYFLLPGLGALRFVADLA